MKKQWISLLLIVSLLAGLLSGCAKAGGQLGTPEDRNTPYGPAATERRTEPTDVPTSEPTKPVEPDESTEPSTQPPDGQQTKRPAPEQPTLAAETDFANMTYTRQDTAAVIEGFAKVQMLVETGSSAVEVIEAFRPVYESYLWCDTMASIAYIHYTLDLDDPYYDEENSWCEEQDPLLKQALEKCCIAMAESPIRSELEALYFGEGAFEFYDKFKIYSNDEVVALMQEESELQNQYMALQNNRTVTWNGTEQLFDDLMDDDSLSYTDLLSVYRAYYDKYNPQAAELFAKLIRVRREIAQKLGYDSYADFAYAYTYQRDYTPAQVDGYIADVASELGSLYYEAATSSFSMPMDTALTMEKLSGVAQTLGGYVKSAYDYMCQYDLYDITSSPSKMPGSYMIYLNAYDMPFVYVSPTDTIDDLLTAAHEFGHFVDGYVNYGQTTSIDCAEIFSQGLEYLTLGTADLSSSEHRKLTHAKAGNAILTFLSQACYAEFENRVYRLPDDELTAERLNQVFLECSEEFGMGLYGMEDILAPGWIDIMHFFVAPYYVISYCISNDAALQIWQAELRDGSGLETYYDLLSLSADNTILALLEESGLESPFDTGRMAELADFLAEQLS